MTPRCLFQSGSPSPPLRGLAGHAIPILVFANLTRANTFESVHISWEASLAESHFCHGQQTDQFALLALDRQPNSIEIMQGPLQLMTETQGPDFVGRERTPEYKWVRS